MFDRNRLVWLGAVHVVVGIASALLALIALRMPYDLERILLLRLLAVVASQAFLIALWGATMTGAPWKRPALLATGVLYSELLVRLGARGDEFLGIPTCMIVLAWTALLALRWFGLGLDRQTDFAGCSGSESRGFQFSIRGMMSFTVAVALLSAMGRALRSSSAPMLAIFISLPLGVMAVGLVALWAVLGGGRPAWRSPVVVGVAAFLGVFFAWAVQAHQEGWVYVISLMLLFSGLVLVSLAVVRSCGYRFHRRSRSSPASPDDALGHEVSIVARSSEGESFLE